MAWTNIPLSVALNENIDEDVLRSAHAVLENGYINESGGISRFPGLRVFATLPSPDAVVLEDWRNDLVAITTGGQVFRLSEAGTVEDVTGAAATGGGRAVTAKTDTQLLIAAGGPIISYSGGQTELLSADAPDSTHVGYISGYVVAIEPNSGRFYHSQPGQYNVWNALDVFSAEGRPDNLNALLVTPFNELLLFGPESVEQFEPSPYGTSPFFRRWSVAGGIHAPYTLCSVDNGTWGVDDHLEFVRLSGQTTRPVSGPTQRTIEAVSDWRGAWASEIAHNGQRFIVLQAPFAESRYGTTGITLLYDYRRKRWSHLYGWDEDFSVPAGWPGRSIKNLWGRTLIGGDGVIYELDSGIHAIDGSIQRLLFRTQPIEQGDAMWVNNLRLRVKRGLDEATDRPSLIAVRFSKDTRGFGRNVLRPLGAAGDRSQHVDFGNMGVGQLFQIEIAVTDDRPVELAGLKLDLIGVSK
jgi:hypothetical protein